ncbi:MAG: PhnD/SsuA/transferrin family substrate-binding protein [Roseobacter sp.]|nr:PhnD/SsuA/transferrin family substrate-binding protein [Roseobacter sp.]
MLRHRIATLMVALLWSLPVMAQDTAQGTAQNAGQNAALTAAQDSAQSLVPTARIGVLAYLGYEDALARWHGLKTYLDAALPRYRFELVPLTLASAATQIASGQVDFVLTNPGHFVDLSAKHAMSVIASRSVRQSDGSYASDFGSLIFARADTGITALTDAAGKTVAAIDKMAFGGFQTAWREFDNAGVNLFTDTAELVFVGFPMDEVVARVATGRADIDIVRSGLIERLIADGHYTAEDFTYLNTSATYTHPNRISTRLYPEWPFAVLAGVDPDLRDSVALALLSAKSSPRAQAARMRYIWTAPVAYHAVKELNAAYTQRVEALSLWQKLWRSGPLLLGALLLPLLVLLASLRRRRRPLAHSPSTAPQPELTNREREILGLIAEGFSSKEIARKLGISPKTVEFHRANLLKKYEARSSSQLVALAS